MKGKKKLDTTQIILIVGIVCILIAICVVGYFLINGINGKKEDTTNTGSLIIDESNLEDVKNQLEESVEKGMFEVNMNTVWTFPNGEAASSDAYVANGNANTLPISFDVLLNDEVIYSSTVIPVGSRIKEIKLDKALPAGSYNAVCMYHLWNEDGTESSSFGVNIQIAVME